MSTNHLNKQDDDNVVHIAADNSDTADNPSDQEQPSDHSPEELDSIRTSSCVELHQHVAELLRSQDIHDEQRAQQIDTVLYALDDTTEELKEIRKHIEASENTVGVLRGALLAAANARIRELSESRKRIETFEDTVVGLREALLASANDRTGGLRETLAAVEDKIGDVRESREQENTISKLREDLHEARTAYKNAKRALVDVEFLDSELRKAEEVEESKKRKRIGED